MLVEIIRISPEIFGHNCSFNFFEQFFIGTNHFMVFKPETFLKAKIRFFVKFEIHTRTEFNFIMWLISGYIFLLDGVVLKKFCQFFVPGRRISL